MIGNPEAPFLNGLASSGALFTESYAVAHPSQPNYLALFSGSTQAIVDDSCPHSFAGPDLATALTAAGNTFTGFSEDLPSAGFAGCTAGSYARKHNPWVNFPAVPAAANQPFTAFPEDFAALPTVSFVIPNLEHDMHDGTIAQADAWLEANLGGYIGWAPSHHSAVLVTFDEDDNRAGNHIATIIAGAGVRAGQYAERIDHYRVLRTICDLFAAAPPGAAAVAAPILDAWVPAQS